MHATNAKRKHLAQSNEDFDEKSKSTLMETPEARPGDLDVDPVRQKIKKPRDATTNGKDEKSPELQPRSSTSDMCMESCSETLEALLGQEPEPTPTGDISLFVF